MSVMSQKVVQFFTTKAESPSGTDLGPIGQCYLTFRLGNKCFMDKFIVLQDLFRDLKLGLNWQFNYKIGCNWNTNGLNT